MRRKERAYPGSARLEVLEDAQEIVVCAGGRNLDVERDQFYFVHQEFTGDVAITVELRDVVHASTADKVGLMLRSGLDDDSPFAAVLFESEVNADAMRTHRVAFRSRRSALVNTVAGSNVEASEGWLRLERSGEMFRGLTSADGVNWTLVSERRIAELPAAVLGGMATLGNDVDPTAGFRAVQASFSALEVVSDQSPRFQRGDGNTNGDVDISNAIFVLSFLFLDETKAPTCPQAADSNDDGLVDLTDPIFLLDHLFTKKQPIPPPFDECGVDTTLDNLSCESVRACRTQ